MAEAEGESQEASKQTPASKYDLARSRELRGVNVTVSSW
jgi:hypothetical protein